MKIILKSKRKKKKIINTPNKIKYRQKWYSEDENSLIHPLTVTSL